MFVLSIPRQDEKHTDAESDDADDERHLIERGSRRREQMQEQGKRQRDGDEHRPERARRRRGLRARRSCCHPDRGQEADAEEEGEGGQALQNTHSSRIADPIGPTAWNWTRRRQAGPTLEPMDTRVVIVEDHPLMLSAIREILEHADGFFVVGTANSGLQVEPLVSRTKPDLVLLDLQLPGLDGLSCLALLREHHPDTTVIVFSGLDEQESIDKALSGGAAAYVSKSITPSDIPAVIRQAWNGTVHFASPQVSRAAVVQAGRQSQVTEARRETGLTARELEVLEAVARGLSNRAVGKELFLSDQTVKFHLHKIFRKLRVTNRTEATRMAYEIGLVADDVAAVS